MALHRAINTFSAGELSPQLDARIDLAKYDSGCQRLENMRPLPWGGVTMRAGTQFIAKAKYADLSARLLPFNFSTSVGFMLEMGDGYIRFFNNKAQITATSTFAWVTATAYRVGDYVTHSGSNYRCLIAHTSGVFATDLTAAKWVLVGANVPYEIVSPYDEDEVFEVQAKEINDVVYLVHPLYPPQKLSRIANNSWTLADVDWKYPALLDENTETTHTLRLDDVAGLDSWLTATAYLVGAYVVHSGLIYRCLIAHTSGTFATDLAAGKWVRVHILSAENFAPFVSTHVGAYWELRQLRDSANVQISLAGTSGTVTSSTIQVKGAWTVTTTDRWYGTLLVQREAAPFDGTVWETIGSYAAAAGRNVNASGTQESEATFRLRYTATGDPYGAGVWAGTAPTSYVKSTATLEVADAYIAGLVQGTRFIDTQGLEVDVINPVETNGERTYIWSEGAWSDYRGFPRSVGLYEQRLLFGGTSYKPNSIWGSKSADFENFTYSDDDDGAVAYQFAACQQNPIQWLESLNRVQAGTSGEECSVGSGNTDEPLTPANVTVRTPSNNGSEYLQPLKVGSKVLFLRRQGTRILELSEASQYAATNEQPCIDLTLLAEHITSVGVVQLGFAQLPDPLVYAVLADGRMGVMTYNKEQNINAWARYLTDGNFESVGVVYGSPADVVYCVVKRTKGDLSGVERFIEVFTNEVADKTSACYGMDSAVLYEGTALTALTGLDHLNGQRVAVTADGCVVGDAFSGVGALTVTGGGIVLPPDQFPSGATVIRVGLRYTGQVQPMKIDTNLANGTSQGRRRRISEVTLRFKDTLGATWGNSNGTRLETNQWGETIPFRSTNDRMDASPPLFTGDKQLTSGLGTALQIELSIQQIQPLPMTLLGIFAKMEVFGE